MKRLWNYIDEKNWTARAKYTCVLWILQIVFALAGLLTWLLVRNFCLSGLGWMFCFMGYPVVAAWYVVFLYSCRHDFHD